jgi:hypothetical protein
MSKQKEASDVVATYGWPEPSVGASINGTLYNVLSREIGGQITYFRVGDVALFEAEGSAPPYVGVIEKLWESPDSEMLLSARWFFRPIDCPASVPLPPDVRSNELFYSSQVRKRLESPTFGVAGCLASMPPDVVVEGAVFSRCILLVIFMLANRRDCVVVFSAEGRQFRHVFDRQGACDLRTRRLHHWPLGTPERDPRLRHQLRMQFRYVLVVKVAHHLCGNLVNVGSRSSS